MHIDSAAHQYTIAITDEQQEAEGISKENLAKIFKIVTDLNQRIDNDFNAGKIVTMYFDHKRKFHFIYYRPSSSTSRHKFQRC